ncbi:MAG: alpha/beta family hydrolase [Dehalococcoidia bacterium]
MPDTSLRIDVEGAGAVGALRTAAKRAVWTFVYAPGASATLQDPFGVYSANALAQHGVEVVRFEFPYMAAKRKAPDRPPLLEATWRAVIDAVRSNDRKLVVGGRSMGGRIASQIVAQGVKIDALALFAYPLHAPGRPEKIRDEHFPSLKCRTLFCSGTNDAFASPGELRSAASKVKRAKVHLLEGADHGFAVKKASGRTREDVWAEAVAAMAEWLRV